ncbi:MAG TPA: hypothetical protein DD415_02565 [Clostridiales bacterium]|nr:hypothetical protein [Clostridiales bacterium]
MSNKYTFRLTPLAEQDIDSALNYIAENLYNAKAASDLYMQIESAIGTICAFPRSSSDCLCFLIQDENIRHIPVDNYVLIYEIVDELKEIRLLRFRYSRMNLKNVELK